MRYLNPAGTGADAVDGAAHGVAHFYTFCWVH